MSPSSSSSVFFELYRDFLQQTSGFWTQAAVVPRPPDPAEAWKQFYGMWTEFWTKCFTHSPDTFQVAQRLWMEQLDTTSKSLENIMGTAAYGVAVSKFFQEQLAWQEKAVKAIHPQIDGALRTINLPSRGQIDRLFERVVGMEERLDDLEAESRQIRQSAQTTTDVVNELKPYMATLATQLSSINQQLEAIEVVNALKQDMATLATQLESMNQQLGAIDARTVSTDPSEPTPTPQTPRARSRRKSPPDS
jgi:hypothetical protein